MRAAVVFVTQINSGLIIRECRLGAPQHTRAAKASTNTLTSPDMCFSACSIREIKHPQQGVRQMHASVLSNPLRDYLGSSLSMIWSSHSRFRSGRFFQHSVCASLLWSVCFLLSVKQLTSFGLILRHQQDSHLASVERCYGPLWPVLMLTLITDMPKTMQAVCRHPNYTIFDHYAFCVDCMQLCHMMKHLSPGLSHKSEAAGPENHIF